MNVLVVSGFLGAGKTTFIKELSRHTGRRFAILENEYGALGIDGDLLKEAGGGSDNIWEMNNGCICCSKKGDFAASILTIANTLNPEFLIIEPSGVGMLSNVIAHIKKVEYERISILAPLTIVDGNNIAKYRREFGSIYDDQILASSTVILSKMEKASYAEREQAAAQIKAIRSDADIVEEHYSNMPDKWWQELLTKLHDGSSLPATDEKAEENFDSLALENVSLLHPTTLILLLEDILRKGYGNIIRAKGALRIGRIGLKFDLVDREYAILVCQAEEIQKAALVFIGKNIQKAKLQKQFTQAGERSKISFRPSAQR